VLSFPSSHFMTYHNYAPSTWERYLRCQWIDFGTAPVVYISGSRYIRLDRRHLSNSWNTDSVISSVKHLMIAIDVQQKRRSYCMTRSRCYGIPLRHRLYYKLSWKALFILQNRQITCGLSANHCQ
jgi:hypothetical protein